MTVEPDLSGGNGSEPPCVGIVIRFPRIGLPLGLLAVVGALQMRQLTSYRMAFIGACSALIPTYAWFLGIPFGIWCLMLLADPGVKSAFQVAAETELYDQ